MNETQLDQLHDELTNDPLGRGYAGMSDTQAADSLNTANRSRNRATMTGSEILNAITPAEWTALTDAKKSTVLQLLALGTLNPFGVEANVMIGVFGGGSTTISTLAGQRVESISRGDELGLGRNATIEDVQKARANF